MEEMKGMKGLFCNVSFNSLPPSIPPIPLPPYPQNLPHYTGMKYFIITSLIFLLGLLCFITCRAQERLVENRAFDLMLKGLVPTEVPNVSVATVQQAENILYLDAREREEFEISHIPGAIWVGYDDFDISRVEGLDEDQQIVVYCSVGYRSGKVAAQLQDSGFANVENLYGGIFEWSNQGLPLVDSSEVKTQKVHGYGPTWGIWVKEGEVVYR